MAPGDDGVDVGEVDALHDLLGRGVRGETRAHGFLELSQVLAVLGEWHERTSFLGCAAPEAL
ncbi:hypothetical protein GCM10027212_24500 [Actinotalea caeni]